MIAENHDGAVLMMVTDYVQHPAGIGAVTDQIAHKGKLVYVVKLGMRKASLQRFTIGMDIGKKCCSHSQIQRMVSGGNANCGPAGHPDQELFDFCIKVTSPVVSAGWASPGNPG
jgi:hypothetical protein